MAVAIAQFTIKDLNDITTSTTAPSNPTNGQLWLDTSTTPNVLKKYNGSSWEVTGASSIDTIGGTNILRNTGNFKDLTYWGLSMGSGQIGLIEIVTDSIKGQVIHATKTNNVSWWVIMNNLYTYFPQKFDVNKQYTISFDIKSLNGTQLFVGFLDGNGTNNVLPSTSVGTIPTTWTRISKTFTPLVTGNSSQLYITGNIDEYWITNVMLEESSKPSNYSPAPEDVQSQIDTINGSITDMSNDNKLTAEEKQLIKKDVDAITQEKAQLDAQATTYGITTEKLNYDTSYTTLYNYVNPLLASLTTTSDVTGSTLRADFSDYFTKRTILQNKIADTAATLKANAIQLGVRNLIRNSNGFFGGTYWSSAITAIDSDSIYGKAFRINNTATTEITIAQTIEIDVLPNTQYTFSALAKGDANVSTCEMYAIGRKSSDSAFAYTYIHGSGNKTLSTTYTKFSFTFTTNSDEVKLFVRFDHNGSKTSGTLAQLWATDFKLEQGNKATDWSPAPEDAQGQIDALNDFVNSTYSSDQNDVYDAIDNATSQLAGTTGGYVVIEQDANKKPYEILIMDTPDRGTAKNVWRWNSGGLGFSSDGYNGPYTTAITSDGKIVADFITAGVMSAARIKGDTLTLGGSGNGNGSISMLGADGTSMVGIWDSTGLNIFNGNFAIYEGSTTSTNKILSINNNGEVDIHKYVDQGYETYTIYDTCIGTNGISINSNGQGAVAHQSHIYMNDYEFKISSTGAGDPNYTGSMAIHPGVVMCNRYGGYAEDTYGYGIPTPSEQFYLGAGNCRIDTTNGVLRLYTSALNSADYGIKINANGEVDFVNNNSSYAYINGSGVAAAKYLRTIYGTGIGVNITENTVDSCTGRLWLNYYSGSSVMIGNGAGNGGYGSLDCGNFTAHGSKNRAVDTENYGTRLMNAFETPECLFADRGRGKIVNGQCIINVDPIFLETVNTKDFSYDVITFPYGPGKVWALTSEMYSDKFIVRGDTDIEFGYMIIAKQKDYENIRLEQYVNNDPELVV